MKGSIHTKAIALTAVVVALAIPAAAFAKTAPQGYRFTTDTLGGNGKAPAAQGVRIITDTLGGNGKAPAAQGVRIITDTLGGTGGPASVPDVFERAVARGQASQPQGYRFITDTLGGNGGPGAVVATTDGGFSWNDAGVGAGVVLGVLALLGASLMLLRHRPLRTA
jgi:hypothetical protein